MELDIDTETLFSKVGGAGNTITSGTATAIHINEQMDRFAIDLNIASGLFTTTSFAVLQGGMEQTTTSMGDIIGQTQTVTAAGRYIWNYNGPAFPCFRLNFTLTGGSNNWLGVTSTCRSVGVK